MNELLYRSDTDNRELRTKLQDMQQELHQEQNYEKERHDKQSKDWELTFDDLTRELRNVQGELTEKEMIFQKMEQELRNKLAQLQHTDMEKSDLRRRLDDLQGEVQHLQTIKFEKEEHLKKQIHKNEGLLEELEKLNFNNT